MTPDEVIANLEKIGVKITRATLVRWENLGLISKPKRGAYGRGGGRWTDYPKEVLYEAYAAWSLMHGEYGSDEFKNFFGGKLPKINPVACAEIRKLFEAEKKIEEVKNKLCSDGPKWEIELLENEEFFMAERSYFKEFNEINRKLGGDGMTGFFLQIFSVIYETKYREAYQFFKDI